MTEIRLFIIRKQWLTKTVKRQDTDLATSLLNVCFQKKMKATRKSTTHIKISNNRGKVISQKVGTLLTTTTGMRSTQLQYLAVGYNRATDNIE